MTTPVTGAAGAASEPKLPLTPDQQLSEQIVAELVEKGLILAEKKDSLGKKLSTGQMKAEDWRLLMAGTIRSQSQPEGGKP